MNTYAKYCPNVFVAKCTERHEKGDIITEFNGSVVDDYNKFNSLFEEVSPNQQVTIKIYRASA